MENDINHSLNNASGDLSHNSIAPSVNADNDTITIAMPALPTTITEVMDAETHPIDPNIYINTVNNTGTQAGADVDADGGSGSGDNIITDTNNDDQYVKDELSLSSAAGTKRKRTSKQQYNPKCSSAKRKPRAVKPRGKKAKQAQDETPASNISFVIERSHQLCARWDRLRLGGFSGNASGHEMGSITSDLSGSGSGSVALNEYLKNVGGIVERESLFTPAQMVQMFQTLHPRIKALPVKSTARKLVKKADHGEGFVLVEQQRSQVNESAASSIDRATATNNTDHESNTQQDAPQDAPQSSLESTAQTSAQDESSTLTKALTSSLDDKIAHLLVKMTSQANDGIAKRRKIHQLDGDEVVDKLRSYENTIHGLKLREENVMKRGRDLGLLS